MKLRPYTPFDFSGLSALMRHWDNGIAVDERLLAEEIPPFLASRGWIVVAEEEGTIIGYTAGMVVVEPLMGRRNELQQMLVHPEFRRRGVATRLIEEAEAISVANDCRTLWLSSRIHLEGAHRFYEAQGFIRSKTSHFYEKIITGAASSIMPAGNFTPHHE